jgi:hypothetical protein
MKYQVIVGNIGTVYDGNDKQQAILSYQDYQAISLYGPGRGTDEPVTLMEDGEPIAEHNPANYEDVP